MVVGPFNREHFNPNHFACGHIASGDAVLAGPREEITIPTRNPDIMFSIDGNFEGRVIKGFEADALISGRVLSPFLLDATLGGTIRKPWIISFSTSARVSKKFVLDGDITSNIIPFEQTKLYTIIKAMDVIPDIIEDIDD